MATRPLTEHLQRHALGREIELYQIDMSKYGLGSKYLVLGEEGEMARNIVFDGFEYEAWGVKSSGWQSSVDGAMARPTLSISNVDGYFTTLVMGNNDLKGCLVTRIRTYDRYLDDGDDPDPTQILPLDVYEINRLASMTNEGMTFELVSLLDKQDVMLPGRQVLRDYCGLIYRERNGSGGFIYTRATCPYVGGNYRTEQDAVTTASNDVCGKRLTSCRARFGENAELPFAGFPGVARVRAS